MPQSSNQLIQKPQISTKTFVRGAFLFSTEDGTGFEENNRNRSEDQIVIEDRGNLVGLKKQIQFKRLQISRKKEKSKKQKHMLIPIRDTPVEPLPEPTMDNNKCQRATQQQFEYFQTYISQKQKQKKFQEEQNRKIELFQREQERFKHNEQNQERKNISIVFQKEEPKSLGLVKNAHKRKGPTIKVVIKKKQVQQSSKQKEIKKIQESENKQSLEKKVKVNQVPEDDGDRIKKRYRQNYNQQEEDQQQQRKVRVVQETNE